LATANRKNRDRARHHSEPRSRSTRSGRNIQLYCVYVAIAKRSTCCQFVKVLEEQGALDTRSSLPPPAADPAPMHTSRHSPAAHALFRSNGMHAVIHLYVWREKAVAYPRCRLLLLRPPVVKPIRADVFYMLRAFRRAGELNKDQGSGSRPRCLSSTSGQRRVAYIPTNVISITDGHILPGKTPFYQGIRPAVNVVFGGRASVRGSYQVDDEGRRQYQW